MNAVEIEEAVSQLAEKPFNAAEFPFEFLAAFGNKPPTIKRLRSGSTNKSTSGGVLQRSNIHVAVAEPGETLQKLAELKADPFTERQKAKFVLATIADLYNPEAMPADLRAAHDRNDETLERIDIGRRFKNDTERLEKLFDMYTKMTVKDGKTQQGAETA